MCDLLVLGTACFTIIFFPITKRHLLPPSLSFTQNFRVDNRTGIDGDSALKEFFTSLWQEVFDADQGLVSCRILSFLAKVNPPLILAILLRVSVSLSFFPQCQIFLDNLSSLDPELYSGLVFLNYSSFQLTFFQCIKCPINNMSRSS